MSNKKLLLFKIIIITLIISSILVFFAAEAGAQEFFFPEINLDISSPEEAQEGEDLVYSLQILILLTILALAPAILIMVTSFTRIVIVLSLIRQALATRNMPPNQVIIGLAIFLTIFVMTPVWQNVNNQAIQPYLEEEITTQEAIDEGIQPLRGFMFEQVREDDIALFVDIAEMERPDDEDDVPLQILIPAFVTSELKYAFQIGFMIYIPFIMIDMTVASILMSMGMLMLPPVMISLPFKILLFVLVDGWHLLIETLIRTF